MANDGLRGMKRHEGPASERINYATAGRSPLLTQQNIIAFRGDFFRLLVLYGQDSTQRRRHWNCVESLIS